MFYGSAELRVPALFALHEPSVLVEEHICPFAADAAGIARTYTAGLQRSRGADVEHTVDRETPPVFPDEVARQNKSFAREFRKYFDIHLFHAAQPFINE